MTTAATKAVPTAKQLTADLYEVFNGLKAKTLDAKAAKEMNNAAGKIISVHRDALKHETEARRKPNMAFYRSLT
jgi:hypothetical protein